MSDDDPLDLAAVGADDAALDRLRTSADDDSALSLLRDLLLDVEADLPAATPVGRGSTVLTLAAEEVPDRRLARSGTVVAVLTAGLLSLGGVAAASTLAPSGTPLHGLGEAVRSAAGAFVGAVTPPESPVAPAASPSPSPTASRPVSVAPAAPRPPAPTAAVPAGARSQAAARQVAQLLDQAQALLADGRTKVAVARLDLAQRTLAQVLPVHRGDLESRLTDLRDRATAAPETARTAPARTARPAPPKQQAPATQEPPARPSEQRKGSPRTATPKPPKQQGGKGGKGAGRPSLVQPSASDASAKPRA